MTTATDNSQLDSCEFILQPADNSRLANLCGMFDEHLRQLENRLGVEINNRAYAFKVIGPRKSMLATERVLRALYEATGREELTPARVHLYLHDAGLDQALQDPEQKVVKIKTRFGNVSGRGPSQCQYLENIRRHAVNFGVGPAGTGKTYLAVASAVDALERDQVRRIVLVRPAVEAGERLGFLPGDLSQKVDPYLRPLYDGLYEMLGYERVAKFIDRGIIEIAPLAYMRGRTLNDSFVILDEAQNTTVEQMKMFLTRIGFGSVAVINGDITQIDLAGHQTSGLRHVIEVLKDVKGISFSFFQSRDVVRHPLVAKILDAYQSSDDRRSKRRPGEDDDGTS